MRYVNFFNVQYPYSLNRELIRILKACTYSFYDYLFPVQSTTMFPQQQAYPPTMANYGIGQGSTFQYGQPPQQYGVPPPAYNTNIGSAPPPTYTSMFR